MSLVIDDELVKVRGFFENELFRLYEMNINSLSELRFHKIYKF